MTDAKASAKGYDYAEKIGKLIAMAEDETLPQATRDAYRNKAEALMREYRIAEEETIARDQFSILPQRVEIVLMESNAYRNPLKQHYVSLWMEIARHAGIRSALECRWEGDDSKIVAVAFGYDMDLRLAQFYWTAARLVFMTRIDARPNPALGDQENCYYLRNSGIKRNDIAEMLWGSARNDGHAHGKVQKLYLAECAKRGEQPRVSGRGIQVSIYREAYANSFVSEFGYRLRSARDAADSVGGALTMKDRHERVDEAFYDAYPSRRPMSEEERAKFAAMHAEREANCVDCAKTSSKTGKCRRHRPTTFTASDYRRWDRQTNSPEAQAGRMNGAAAARSVDVERTAGPRAQRADRAPERTALGS